MNNIRVGTRLIVAFILVSLLTTVVSFLGYYGLKTVYGYLDKANNAYIPGIVSLADIRFNMRNVVVAHRTLLSEALPPQERQRQHGNLAESVKQYQAARDEYEKMPRTREQQAGWAAFTASLKEAEAVNAQANNLLADWEKDPKNEAKYQKASDLVLGEAVQANRKANDALAKLLSVTVQQADVDEKDADGKTDFLTMLMVSLAVLAPLASILLGLLITRSIVKPLTQNMAFSQAVAAGDLGATLGVSGKDETGRLADGLRSMVGALKEKIAEAEKVSAQAAQEAENARLATAEAQKAKEMAERAKQEGMLQAAGRLEGVVEIVTSASGELSA